jgi:hypothetical protein
MVPGRNKINQNQSKSVLQNVFSQCLNIFPIYWGFLFEYVPKTFLRRHFPTILKIIVNNEPY